ncbi:MAG: Na(+)/H(+) antiporter subunit B [Acetobacteraceae bacterium]|nr:Na(+)/H(+) antiporter subunit B [Acetobacteraceae bacterium]MCX7685551.1 Na(+)/H(+) antiporter subunit B [Acetobacteraceae bacterium]MDW8399797.1 MnhB domain-containing protein [Acetobacteraceae bacterium]
MNDSLILKTSARYLLVTALLLSVFVLMRGHNEPGGGFIGGLIAAAGLAFYGVAFGRRATCRVMRLHPLSWCGIGLLSALASGLPALFSLSAPFLKHYWLPFHVIPGVSLGTAVVFDIGVYLTVVGFVLGFLLPFFEE